MSKFDRRNQAKQARISKHKEHLSQASLFSGRDGAPRIVAVLPLCHNGDAKAAIRQLNSSLDIEDAVEDGLCQVPVNRFKQKLQYIPLQRDLSACMDAAKVADFIVVILSATVEVDELGELILRSVEGQGMSTLFTLVEGLEKVESTKQKQSVLGSLKSFITHFHPEQEKLFNVDSRQECSNLIRSLCNTTPKGIHWRDERSWMLAEDVLSGPTENDLTRVTGIVRGRGLKADRLVQVGDWGAYKVAKIVAAPLLKEHKAETSIEEETVLEEPTEDQDDLNELAPDNVMMEEEDIETMSTGAPAQQKGVLLDEHHYFSEGEEEEKAAPRRVPKGTSKYQSAWYLDDVSDASSDLEDMEMDEPELDDAEAAPEDGIEGYAPPEATEAGPSEYPQTEAMEELNENEDAIQLAQYRASKRGEVENDKEFPDEIELPPNVLARERLARYRGLKSLRTSEWQEDEDRPYEPDDWRRLLQIPDYQASRLRSTREALVGGIQPGTRVHIYLKDIPLDLVQKHDKKRPLALVSLLRHEQKKTVVNYLLNLSSDYPKSIKAKDELIAQCGSRRMVIKPIFSQLGTTPNDVHKSCRYVHPGQSVVASFMGPVTWGSVPVLFFKKTTTEERSVEDGPKLEWTLVGTGTALPPSTSRVVAKRVILTGHPYHIHKKIVTIRYMFFNREDVEWFKALPLWTRRGRSGFVKDPLGTHGYFKATFDGRINPQDAVGVSLYKRMWPRDAVSFQGLLLEGASSESTPEDADMTM